MVPGGREERRGRLAKTCDADRVHVFVYVCVCGWVRDQGHLKGCCFNLLGSMHTHDCTVTDCRNCWAVREVHKNPCTRELLLERVSEVSEGGDPKREESEEERRKKKRTGRMWD